ncbi:hypothetical protein C3L33_19103, partial [Rhododendron williamsianum]
MGSLVMEPDDMASYASSTFHPEDNFSTICMSVGKINSRGIFHDDPLNFSLPLLLIQLSLASLVILFSSRLLKHLGQPSMVPQILGGIILGPSVLGRTGGFTEHFFPLRGFIILDAIAAFGYIFYFFLIGVQVDPWIVKKIEKREIIIGVSTVALALVLSISWSFLVLAKITIGLGTAGSLPVVATAESALSFPMMAQYLTEQKMINSEFGRLALSCSLASNLFSFCIITLTILTNQQSGERFQMLKTLCSGVAMALVIFGVVRPMIMRMLKRKTKGESLTEEFISIILVGVLVAAFASQALGLHIGYGPLLYGLALPAGPPLGSAVFEKLELINSWLFMPLYFVKNGLVTDIFSVDFKSYLVVQYIIAIAWVGKFIGALVSSVYCSIPYKDAILLGLVMNVQGVLELGMYKMMKQAKAIDHEAFVVMCISMLLLVSTTSPLIRYLYDPSRRYAVYNQRTVMHLGDNSELRVVACIHDQDNVPTMISLLEAINPSKRSPVAIYALHLIELVGRSNPLLIPHKLSKRPSSNASSSKSIVNAFRLFEQSNSGNVSVHPFTAISPYVTMHDEICTMALEKKASLIILPFHERYTTTDVWEAFKKGVKIMNDNILDMAPCSIAIIVDSGLLHNSRPMLATWSSYRVAILFLGGADDREALAIGARMAGQPNINVTMVRLLENGSIASDNSMERKLDNEVVSKFRLNMAGNYRVKYIEEVAKDGTGTVAVLRSMKNNYELIIVGRRHEKKSPLVFGLTGLDEDKELGEVGYILASSDFRGNSSILVVQQHSIVWDAKDFTVDMSREIEDEAEHLRM